MAESRAVESTRADLAAIAKKKKERKEGRKKMGFPKGAAVVRCPPRLGILWFLTNQVKPSPHKNHSFTLLALQEVPLLHATIWFPCRAL